MGGSRLISLSLFSEIYLSSNSFNIFYHLAIHIGGFGGNIGHDPHILYTLSAVQILALFDKINVIDIDKVSNCILQHLVLLLSDISVHIDPFSQSYYHQFV